MTKKALQNKYFNFIGGTHKSGICLLCDMQLDWRACGPVMHVHTLLAHESRVLQANDRSVKSHYKMTLALAFVSRCVFAEHEFI